MIRAYVDMAGTKETRVYTAGCYVGNDMQWAAAEAEWDRALRLANVDHFHATDFFNCWGAFRGWTRGSRRHREAERRFLRVAADANLGGIFVGLDTAGFTPEFREALNMVKARYRASTTRMICAQGCFIALRDGWRKIPQPHHERIAVTFEHEQGIGEVISNFVAHKQRRVAWTEGIISANSAGKKEQRPLQFADLLAYEAHQYLTHLASQPAAEPHPRLAQLRAGERTIGRFMTVENSRVILPLLLAWYKQHPAALTNEARRALEASATGRGQYVAT